MKNLTIPPTRRRKNKFELRTCFCHSIFCIRRFNFSLSSIEKDVVQARSEFERIK